MRLNYKDCGKIGFTCSTFDLLHAGHITMLEEAKHHCDYLIVGLQNDPTEDRPEKNSPETPRGPRPRRSSKRGPKLENVEMEKPNESEEEVKK